MKLNQPIMQAINLACTPIHIPFIYFAFKWGESLFGAEHAPWVFSEMRRELAASPLAFIQHYGGVGLHAIVVWTALVPFWAVIIYYTARPIMRGIEKARLAAAARTAAEKARNHPVP
jgi:hypothetical protein